MALSKIESFGIKDNAVTESKVASGAVSVGKMGLGSHLIPSADNTFDLGSSGVKWKDVHIGPGSLYINGKKVIEDASDQITISTDTNQNLIVKTAGTGDIEFNPSGTGNIQIKGTLQIQSGELITDSAAVKIQFADDLDMNSNKITELGAPTASTDAATKAYVDAQTHEAGDITSVVAGTGLSGGGTSGAVTLTLDIPDNAVGIGELAGIARGKVIYGDSSGNPALLTVGSSGQVLISDGTDVSWGAVDTLPTQTSQSGKFLTTDGTDASWAVNTGGATTADTAPGSPSDGQLWWKSDEGRLKVYYDDGSSSQWVDTYIASNTQIADSAVTSAKIADGAIVNADINASAAIAGTKVGDKVGLLHRNIVHNGQFDVWQRGTTITLNAQANMYYCDMWRHEGYGVYCSVSRQTFTNGQTTVPDNPTYYARFIITTNDQGYQAFVQRIENNPVNRFAGEQITVSFWMRSVSGTIADGVIRGYGKNSLDSSGTDNIGAITTSWQKYSWTGTMGTPTNYITTGLIISQDTTFSNGIDIANFQYEFGATSTEFEQKPYVQTLEDCQRYYSKSYNIDTAPGTASSAPGSQSSIAIYSSGSQHGPGVRFPTRMRTTPTVVIYSPGTGASGNAQNAANNADIATTAGEIGEAGFQFITGSLPTGDTGMRYHWTADAGH